MSIRSRIGSLLKNMMLDRVERDLDDELRAYVEMAADEKRGTGLSDEDARRAALIELGGVEQVRESVRDARTGAVVEQFRQDLFYACRMLRRNPALGATRTMVFQQVLSEAVGLAFAGLVIGCLASLALTRFITSLLFGITATDMATYIAVSGVLGAITLVASYVPARRATAVDPLIALRQE